MTKAGNMEKPDGSRMVTTVAGGWLRGIRKSVVFNQGDFAPQETFGNVLEVFLVARTAGRLLASSVKRPRKLLNILNCTRQLPRQTTHTQMSAALQTRTQSA